MAERKVVGFVISGLYSTQTLAAAKLIDALIIPSWLFSILSTLAAHEAQLMPVTGKLFLIVVSMSLSFQQS